MTEAQFCILGDDAAFLYIGQIFSNNPVVGSLYFRNNTLYNNHLTGIYLSQCQMTNVTILGSTLRYNTATSQLQSRPAGQYLILQFIFQMMIASE